MPPKVRTFCLECSPLASCGRSVACVAVLTHELVTSGNDDALAELQAFDESMAQCVWFYGNSIVPNWLRSGYQALVFVTFFIAHSRAETFVSVVRFV